MAMRPVSAAFAAPFSAPGDVPGASGAPRPLDGTTNLSTLAHTRSSVAEENVPTPAMCSSGRRTLGRARYHAFTGPESAGGDDRPVAYGLVPGGLRQLVEGTPGRPSNEDY